MGGKRGRGREFVWVDGIGEGGMGARKMRRWEMGR